MQQPTPDDVLAALDPEQRAVAQAPIGPVRVLAGAGTGKTRAITHRIAYGVLSGAVNPGHVLAVTFTTRAAGEMRSRLRDLGAGGVATRTFHAAALRQLQYFWPRHVGGPLPPLAPHKAGLVAEAAGRARLRVDRTGVRDLAAEIEWAKVTQTAAPDYPAKAAAAGRPPPAGLDPEQVARLIAGYEEVKRERGVIDFEDVLVYALGLLAETPEMAATVRGQYRHFVVDEYQDVSPLQQQLLDLWLGERDSLCVVGDASQTIYSFTGATPEFLLGFTARFPHATLVELVRDYRSTPQVVALANGLLDRAGAAASGRLELVAQRPSGPAAQILEYDDEAAEARGVAERIQTLLRTGIPPSAVAVLFRVNAQSEVFESALVQAGIPCLLRGGERFFDRPEVRQAHLLLRGAARAYDPHVGLVSAASAALVAAGWSPEPPPAAGGGAVRARWESLTALLRLAEDMATASPEATLADLVAELDERAGARHPPTVEGVTLASLHAAKGLEWDAVFLTGLVEGMLPISYAETAAAVEEERRLLYVGVTRARVHVTLSWARARAPGGRRRRASRFLDGLLPVGRRHGAAAAAAGGRRRGRGPAACRVCGRALGTAAETKLGRCTDCPSSYDEAVLERLRQWRLSRAREASLPAYCIFTDATLIAIAEAHPRTRPELAAIPGVGRTKLERYSADLLALCAGAAAAAATRG